MAKREIQSQAFEPEQKAEIAAIVKADLAEKVNIVLDALEKGTLLAIVFSVMREAPEAGLNERGEEQQLITGMLHGRPSDLRAVMLDNVEHLMQTELANLIETEGGEQ